MFDISINNVSIKTKRIILFLFGCILTRLILVYIAKNVNDDYLSYLGYLAIIPAFVWLYLYFGNKRKTGPEVFGQSIWWNNLRPVHSILYLCFAYSAINKNRNSYIYLLIDVIIGFLSFIVYHFIDDKIFA